MVLFFFGGSMQITMKSSSCAPTNWVAQLMNFGIKATRRPSVFGRTAHVFKLQGEAVELLQDPQQTVSSVVETLTQTQKRIVDALIACDVVVNAPQVPKRKVRGYCGH
ncbi:MAG: hypothetical protein B7X65_22360 [Polaromonas sp. 39-63-25]|nr:MAG: hypothetical protein B7Y09_23135 [Polaromonas sp. 24-63-21]OZA85254.1 MAG: hypothetical protein B7X65_22360 [Polaromonas sp. 39-63-25]